VASIAEIRAKETGRIEAFSDGIFAFAITLLVLYLKAPDPSESNLLLGLAAQWPTFFAFVTSFMTILIMWVGHHEMFAYIVRADRRFMFLNGFLLFFITLTPFTTSLVAGHIASPDSRAAGRRIFWRLSPPRRRLEPFLALRLRPQQADL
jgi:uncharacterized membrane protein